LVRPSWDAFKREEERDEEEKRARWR